MDTPNSASKPGKHLPEISDVGIQAGPLEGRFAWNLSHHAWRHLLLVDTCPVPRHFAGEYVRSCCWLNVDAVLVCFQTCVAARACFVASLLSPLALKRISPNCQVM